MSGRPVLYVLAKVTCQAHLSSQTCFSCPVPVGLFQPDCPVWLSCHDCPVPVALFQLSCHYCHVLAVLSSLSCLGCVIPTVLSGWPVPDVPFCLSGPSCPFPVIQPHRSCSSCRVPALFSPALMSLMFCPYCQVRPSSLVCLVHADLSMMIHQADLSVHADLLGQSSPSCHIPHVLSRLCCNGCPATIVLSFCLVLLLGPSLLFLAVMFWLFWPFCPLFPLLAVLSGLPSPAVLSRLSCPSFHVLAIMVWFSFPVCFAPNGLS